MYDVAVVGAGPAGCSTALALRRNGVAEICIVDSALNRRPRVGETLVPEAGLVLHELGLREDFGHEGHEPCLGSCSCWGSDVLGHNDFLLSPYGPGWHLDRARFDAFLVSKTKAHGTYLYSGTVIGCCQDSSSSTLLQVKDHRGARWSIGARFVVDASGSRSALARTAGAQPRFLDRLTFLYGFFDTSSGSSALQLTMLEAVPEGWWYAAPLPHGRLAVAFASEPDIVRRHALADDEAWLAALLRTRHIASRLEGCRFLRGSLIIRAGVSFLLDRVAGARWLAVGDAAASYDPLASQGIQKALEGGIRAAKCVTAALSCADAGMHYAASVAADFAEYTANRNHFYHQEQRWAESPFWRRRRARTQLCPPARSRPTLTCID